MATVAYYGQDDSKVVAAIVEAEGLEPDLMKKWFSETGDVRKDDDICR